MSAGSGQGDKWLIGFASQSGFAEQLAWQSAGQLQAAGHAVNVQPLASLSSSHLREARHALFVVSTFGDGDPPDNASDFWHSLQSAEADALVNSCFSVLALGDSSYQQFCGFGRKLDERLAALGAERLQPRLECEHDSHAPAEQWLTQLCSRFASNSAAPTV
ncbi:flavodoxin domain-containing protein, partial [Pseudomonas viridiflava]|uniref:flavodoxin domain-containing protein n=1 Tax=Pseudomonas viridiflava TaxID=33069 RepID=UPI003C6DE096